MTQNLRIWIVKMIAKVLGIDIRGLNETVWEAWSEGRKIGYQVGFIQGEAQEWRRWTGQPRAEESEEDVEKQNKKEYILN